MGAYASKDILKLIRTLRRIDGVECRQVAGGLIEIVGPKGSIRIGSDTNGRALAMIRHNLRNRCGIDLPR